MDIMDIKDKFIATIKKYNMFEKGEAIMVGVSGGPDSICLLHLLLQLRDEWHIKVSVAHLDHMFRGKESEEDALFVKELCEKWDLPFYQERQNVPGYVRETGFSPEDAARRIRYAFYERAKQKLEAEKVALGHNQDDHVETVLMNILRGSGLDGLVGIEPVREYYIRPLIEIPRRDIEKYLKAQKLDFRTDRTNLSPEYFRNRLRLELIPLIEQKYCKHLSQSLLRLSDIVRQDLNFLEKQTCLAMNGCVKFDTKKVMIKIKEFMTLDEAIRRRVIRKCVERFAGDVKDFELKNIRLLLQFIEQSDAGSQMNLPKNLTAQKDYEFVYIYHEKNKSLEVFEYPLPVPGTFTDQSLGITIESSLEARSAQAIVTNNPLIAQLDYDKIIGNLILRNRRPGDRFFPLGMSFSKKVQDFLTDLKVPRRERDKIPIVVDGAGRIVWIAGFRPDDRFKITTSTRMVLTLKMSVNRGQEDLI